MKKRMATTAFVLSAVLASAGAVEFSRIEADVSALPEANRFVGRMVEERVEERVPPIDDVSITDVEDER